MREWQDIKLLTSEARDPENTFLYTGLNSVETCIKGSRFALLKQEDSLLITLSFSDATTLD